MPIAVENPYRKLAGKQPARGQTQKKASQAQMRKRANRQATPRRQASSRQEEHIYDQDGNFNPVASVGRDWRTTLSGVVPKARDRMFDGRGRIQAANNREALEKAAYMMRDISPFAQPRQASVGGAGGMTREAQRRVVAQALRSSEGFEILGQELLLPIKDIVDYESWCRKIFRVRPLGQGEFFRIAKDVRAEAFLIGQDGQGVESRLQGKFVQPDEFKLAAFPSVDLEDIYTVNYDILERAQDTARQAIEREEDKRGRALLDAASTAVNSVTTITSLDVDTLESIRREVERHRLVAESFLINRDELTDLIQNAHTTMDPVSERELILAGYVGRILNCNVITAAGTGVEEVVPSGTVYCVTGPEYLGELGVRVELFSEPYNNFGQQRLIKGWAFAEIVGFVIPNPRSVAKGVK